MASYFSWQTDCFTCPNYGSRLKFCRYCGKQETTLKCSHCSLEYCSKACIQASKTTHAATCKSSVLHNLVTSFICRKIATRAYALGQLTLSLQEKLEVVESIRETIDTVRKWSFRFRQHTTFIETATGRSLSQECLYIDCKQTKWGAPDNTVRIQFSLSRCTIIYDVLLAYIVTPVIGSISSEFLSMLLLIQHGFSKERQSIRYDYYPFTCVSLSPYRTFLPNNEYATTASNKFVDLPSLLLTNLDEYSIIYIIEMIPNDHTSMEEHKWNWEELTSSIPTSRHVFLLFRNCRNSCLLQSYQGYYTYLQWLDFSTTLTQMPTWEPATEGWFREILPKPKYRGIWRQETLVQFATDLQRLTKEDDHIQRYADITGILHDKRSISKSYRFCFSRLDLNRIIYV
jgi:hypothetical protein